jgi:uncharacterized protein (TIGR03437 family)
MDVATDGELGRSAKKTSHARMGFLIAAMAAGPLLADSSCPIPGQTTGAPCYTAASIANSASNLAGPYSPNSFVTIYGTNLSYVTKAIASGDIATGELPWALTGTEVSVLIGGVSAYVYYVSPNQVNVLIPLMLTPGSVTLELDNRSLFGPPVEITLQAAAPALFQADATTVVATHGNGPPVTADSPAAPGEIVVLYATGLGVTAPAAICGWIPELAAPLADLTDFEVLLNGAPVDPKLIQYAGQTPGFAGLFQINLQLPGNSSPNPEIRIGFVNNLGSNLSPAQLFLPVQ